MKFSDIKKLNFLLVPLIVSSIVSLAAMGLFFSKTLNVIDWIFLDKAYQSRSVRNAGDVPLVIIEIDKESLFTLGEWPWARDIHARLVTDVSSFGAKCVAFDIYFISEVDQSTVQQDFIFSQACKVCNDVYFSLNFEINDQLQKNSNDSTESDSVLTRFSYPLSLPSWIKPHSAYALSPVKTLYESTVGSGHISVLEDVDGKIRRIPLWLENNGRYYPQLALRVFIDSMKVQTVDFPHKGIMRMIAADKRTIMVPVDNRAQYFIDWCGPFGKSFYYCSYVDVIKAFQEYAEGNSAPMLSVRTPDNPNVTVEKNAFDFFKDKICFVGFTTAGLIDQKPVTVSTRYPLVGIHANLFENLYHGNFFHETPPWIECVIILLFSLIATALVITLSLGQAIPLLIVLLVAWAGVTIGLFMYKTVWISPTYIYFSVLMCFLSGVVYRITTERKKTRYIKQLFKRYVAPDVVETILRNPELMELGGQRRMVTVMFCDIRDFTALAETLAPEEVIRLLNTFFSLAVDSVFKYHGTVDKFIGDCIMAYWGAPTPLEDHALYAVKTALDIQAELKKRNNVLIPDEKEQKIEVGIGICSGEVVVGNVGMAEKKFQKTEYTVIGDYVNLAARLVDLAPRNDILISSQTYAMVQEVINARPLPSVMVKGKREPVQIYKVLDAKPVQSEDMQ